MSLGYLFFVFTDEGDCMVTETFGCLSSWSASVSRTIKISTWCHLLATQDFLWAPGEVMKIPWYRCTYGNCFSLENAGFHTESREIAKGCTETHCMKKEDEQFGHSTLLVFYLPMVSSIFEGLLFWIWRPGGYKSFFWQNFGLYYQYGHAWTIPTYSLLTLWYSEKEGGIY